MGVALFGSVVESVSSLLAELYVSDSNHTGSNYCTLSFFPDFRFIYVYVLHYKLHKSSTVAEMGDRLATIDMGRIEG